MVKSNKKPNRLAELAKELKEQPAQKQPPPTTKPQQLSTSGGLFGLAEQLAKQTNIQPQASHPEPSQALSSAKTSKLFALDKQLHGKPNQPDSQPQPQSEVSQAQNFDRNEPIVVQSRDRETAEAFDWNEPIVLESPHEESAEAFDWNEPIVLESPGQEPDLSELSNAQAVQLLPLGSYLLESLENPTQTFAVEPFESFQPANTPAVETQFAAETVTVASPSVQPETAPEPPPSPPLTQTQVTEPKPASSEPVTKVSPPLESPQLDANPVSLSEAWGDSAIAMPKASAQKPVTPNSEEPQPPIDAKALAVELLNLLQTKQASQAQNQSPAAALGLEMQDVVRSNPPSETTTESKPVPATAISSFDELDKRLEAENQREEAIYSVQAAAEAPLKPTTPTVISPFDELDRRMEKEKQRQEMIAQAQAVTESEAKPVTVTVFPSFDELDERLEKEKQREKESDRKQALTEPARQTVTVTVVPSFDELDKRLEAEKQESIPVVAPDLESNLTAQLPAETTQELPSLNSSQQNTLAEVQAVSQTKVESVESEAVALKADDESSSLWDRVFEDFDRRLDLSETQETNPQSAITTATVPNVESLSNTLELVETELAENLAFMAEKQNKDGFELDVYVTNELLGLPIKGAKLTLNQKQMQVVEAEKGKPGHYIFKQVEPDKYSLQIKVSDRALALLPLDIQSTPDSPLKLILPGLYCSPEKELKERFKEFISWYLEADDSSLKEQEASFILNLPDFHNEEPEKFSLKWLQGKIAFYSDRKNSNGDNCFDASIDESGGSLERQGGFIYQIYSLGSDCPPVKSYISAFISICGILKTSLIGLEDNTSFKLGNHTLYRRVTDCFAYGQPYYAQFNFRPLAEKAITGEKTELVLKEKPEFTLKDYYEACDLVKLIQTPQLKEMLEKNQQLKEYLNLLQEAKPCKDNETVGLWWRALHPEKNQVVSKEKEIQEAMFKFYQAIFTPEGCEANHLPSDWTKWVKILSVQKFARTYN